MRSSRQQCLFITPLLVLKPPSWWTVSLEEHSDRTPVAPNTDERFVVAETGANFEVHVRFSHPFPTNLPVSFMITVDGKDLDEPLIRQHELYDEDGHVIAGPVPNADREFVRQKYQFAKLDVRRCIWISDTHLADTRTREDLPTEDVERQKTNLASTGTISLNSYWIQKLSINITFEAGEREVQDVGPVHEKALKGSALSHAVNLEDPEPIEEHEYCDAEYADDGEPFATFHFYYRSLNLNIVRQTPEPVELNDCDDDVIQTSSEEELRRMIAHWKRRDEVRLRLKRERSGSVTVVVHDEALDARSSSTAIGSDNVDDDVIVLGAVDLRRERLKRRKPTVEDEVISLD